MVKAGNPDFPDVELCTGTAGMRVHWHRPPPGQAPGDRTTPSEWRVSGLQGPRALMGAKGSKGTCCVSRVGDRWKGDHTVRTGRGTPGRPPELSSRPGSYDGGPQGNSLRATGVGPIPRCTDGETGTQKGSEDCPRLVTQESAETVRLLPKIRTRVIYVQTCFTCRVYVESRFALEILHLVTCFLYSTKVTIV